MNVEPNYKGQLIEHCQKMWKQVPTFSALITGGSPHEPIWSAQVILPDGSVHQCGKAYSKRGAEQRASANAIMALIRGGPSNSTETSNK